MFKTPFILPLIYPNLTWKINTQDKVIYLTFDDGPIPEITEFVLQALDEYNAKATFFCIGENIEKHPEIFRKIIESGHSVGNHTYNHLNGWKTADDLYIRNMQQCQEVLQQHGVATKLARPPYGRIKKSQIKALTTNHELIMWSVLSKDYNPKVLKETALRQSIKHTQNGSIVVFHDSIKAYATLQFVLPRFLKHFSSLGFRFGSLRMMW